MALNLAPWFLILVLRLILGPSFLSKSCEHHRLNLWSVNVIKLSHLATFFYRFLSDFTDFNEILFCNVKFAVFLGNNLFF